MLWHRPRALPVTVNVGFRVFKAGGILRLEEMVGLLLHPQPFAYRRSAVVLRGVVGDAGQPGLELMHRPAAPVGGGVDELRPRLFIAPPAQSADAQVAAAD